MNLQEKINLIPSIIENLDKVIYGQEFAKKEIIKWFLANEHVLIESSPWLWKTDLIKSLAKSSGLKYKRIQWTPDLMPQDILGYTTISGKKVEGPIMTNILLVDEINRINPKTLSALLSAMSEKVVVDVDSWNHIPLPDDFFVIATQNPIETIWTFELPEAVKDRFSIKVNMEKEKNVLINAYKLKQDNLPCNISNNLLEIISAIFDNLDPKLTKYDYIKKYFKSGPSIRAWLQFIKIVKVSAFMEARDFVVIDDIKNNIIWVFKDKIILNDDFDVHEYKIEDTLKKFISDIIK